MSGVWALSVSLIWHDSTSLTIATCLHNCKQQRRRRNICSMQHICSPQHIYGAAAYMYAARHLTATCFNFKRKPWLMCTHGLVYYYNHLSLPDSSQLDWKLTTCLTKHIIQSHHSLIPQCSSFLLYIDPGVIYSNYLISTRGGGERAWHGQSLDWLAGGWDSSFHQSWLW